MRKIDNKINELFSYNTEAAFRLLNNTYYEILVLKAYKMIPDIMMAENLVQDAFVKLYKNEIGTKILNYEAYLYKCIKTSFIKLIKQSKGIEYVDTMSEICGEEQQSHNNIAKIKMLIDQLPAQQKQILIHYINNDCTYHDLSEDFQISHNTVKKHIKLAYRYIRENISIFLFFLS